MKQKGFTLLELLIAISLVAVVLGAIYSTFFLSERAISAYKGYAIRLYEARRVLDLLSKELKSTIYNIKDKRTAFVVKDRDIYGRQASEIEFITVASPEGPYRVSYYVKEDRDSNMLMKRLIHLNGNQMEVIACRDIESFSVKVYDGKRWYAQWSPENRSLPKKIELTLEIKVKDRTVSLKEMVRPMIEVMR
jgi:general secretion pathway protein J